MQKTAAGLALHPTPPSGDRHLLHRIMSGQNRGIILILLSYLLMTGETVAIHQIGDAATPLQLILMRNLGGAVLVAILARNIGFAVFRTGMLWLQFGRAALTMISLWGIFYGFAALPLADATAITYTRAVFLSLFAAVILRETLGGERLFAIGAGIAGSLIIIGPAFSSWQPDYLIALGGAALNAGAMVATKVMERRDSTLTIMAWLTTLSLIACLPALAAPLPPVETWPWLLAIAVLGTSGLYIGLMAIRATDLTVLAPFDYTRLIMAAAFGMILFGEIPGLQSFIGAAIITVACTAAAMSVRPPTPSRSQ
ncbi:MAG: DMT family transporter [Acetobacteraceae bacterium]